MYGVALEGGGIRGAYHLGAVKALKECGIEIGGYVGTSIGAFNAAVLAQGDFKKLYDRWYDASATICFDIKEDELKKLSHNKMDLSSIKYWSFFLKNSISNKGIDTTKLKALYEEMIDEKKLRKSKLDYGMVTVSVSDKKPIYMYKENIEDGMISSYVLASSNLPVFKLDKILNDEKVYVDGGFYDNCPITLLKKKGYKDIIEIRTHAIGRYKKIDRRGLNIITIDPSKDLGSILFSDNEIVRNNMKMGYFDTLRVLKGYIGDKFYVIPDTDDIAFNMLVNLTDEKIGKIIKDIKINGIDNMEPKKILFGKVIPLIESKFKGKDTSTYQKLIVSMIEYITKDEMKIYKLYTFDELVAEVKKKIPSMLKKERSAIIKNNEKLLILNLLKNV